ncbi:hypothetical protein GCM10009118_24550 [Wandonia haliotis]|uniref:Uncharacterized protein n=1 Tax=Wandonia haliotis TaxID=574963 RepID=A0ABN1MRS2_9FLAO
MKTEEIFTNDAWDDLSQELFWERLKKKRTNKIHFIKTKAFVFLDKPSVEEKEIGINILEEAIKTYFSEKSTILSKEKYPSIYKEEIIRTAVLLAEILVKQDRIQKATELLDLAEKDLFTQEQPENWNCQTYFFNDAYVLRAEIAIHNKNATLAKQCIQQARRLQESDFMKYLEIETRLAWLTQDFSETDKKWSDWYALEEYPFETLMQIDYTSAVNNEVSMDFWDAAETFRVNHESVLGEDNIESLKRLDNALKFNKNYSIERLDKTYLRERYIHELGAYIGEVVNKELNGKWIKESTLTSSNVQIGNELISPFKMAYDTVFLKRRLAEDLLNTIQK